jgi:hypothetical protein
VLVEQTVSVQVPAAEAADLDKLVRDLAADTETIESRAFDGGLVVTAVVTVVTATLPVLRSWLLARSQERRTTKVTIRGKQFQGYSADEVIAMLEADRQGKGS